LLYFLCSAFSLGCLDPLDLKSLSPFLPDFLAMLIKFLAKLNKNMLYNIKLINFILLRVGIFVKKIYK